jgi:hypothetical protein
MEVSRSGLRLARSDGTLPNVGPWLWLPTLNAADCEVLNYCRRPSRLRQLLSRVVLRI